MAFKKECQYCHQTTEPWLNRGGGKWVCPQCGWEIDDGPVEPVETTTDDKTVNEMTGNVDYVSYCKCESCKISFPVTHRFIRIDRDGRWRCPICSGENRENVSGAYRPRFPFSDARLPRISDSERLKILLETEGPAFVAFLAAKAVDFVSTEAKALVDEIKAIAAEEDVPSSVDNAAEFEHILRRVMPIPDFVVEWQMIDAARVEWLKKILAALKEFRSNK